MSEQTYQQRVAAALSQIREIFPWDLAALQQEHPEVLIVDIREANEVATGRIAGSLHVPRGILEAACDWGYAETVPALARARDKPVVLACRSGNRSALATLVLQQMGYTQVYSLKTGIRGWNDYELPLLDSQGVTVDLDEIEMALSPPVSAEQRHHYGG